MDDILNKNLEEKIDKLWHNVNNLKKDSDDILIEQVIDLLSDGKISVAQKNKDSWIVNGWIKKAILLYFKIKKSYLIKNSIIADNDHNCWFDKIDSKFLSWREEDFINSAIRAVPGCFVRKGSYIGKNTVLMPSFVNIGAYIGDNTMIDTWSTIGSCAYIGNNCHISGGVGIGGVLEPIGSVPVIIEDDCFIGARSEIVEGVIIGKGSVISMGVYIGASTKIIDKSTNDIIYGYIPEYSVVIPGNYNIDGGKLSTYCAIIIKKVDAKTKSKTSTNELLRL